MPEQLKQNTAQHQLVRFFLFGTVIVIIFGGIWFASGLHADQDIEVKEHQEEPLPFESLQVLEKTEKQEVALHIPASELHPGESLYATSEKPLLLDEAEEKDGALSLYGATEDATRETANVRATKVKAGMDLRVSENASVGVEASKGFHDQGDAKAWNQGSLSSEETANVKYQMQF